MTSPDLMTQLAAIRPATIADDGWAASAAGQDCLGRIHLEITRPAPRRRPRRMGLSIFAAVTIAGGGATAYALATHARHPVTTEIVACLKEASVRSDASVVPLPEHQPANAIAACSQTWQANWPGTPKPTAFALCIYPHSKKHGAGGALMVIPAVPGTPNDDSCAAIGADTVSR